MPEPETALAEFGRSLLGYDIETGEKRIQPDVPGIPAATLASATKRPGRYGFHATLKAPFRLGPGRSRVDVLALAAEVADRHAPLELKLEFARFRGFLAFLPVGSESRLSAIADDCVQALECVRAPMDDGEMKARLVDDLTERQRRLLERWGYPYVFDEYQFHMTLSDAAETTGPLERGIRTLVGMELLAAPAAIESICVVEETGPNDPLHLVARLRLRGRRET